MTVTADRNDLPGAEQQRELAGVLRGLRLAAGTSPEDFAAAYEISPLQVRFIEDAAAIPARTHLYAYLDLADDDARTRARVLKLWSLVHKSHTKRRHARRDHQASLRPNVPRPESPPEHEETLLETTVTMKPLPLSRQETRLTLSKPAWRRAAQVSKADSALWPDPGLLQSAAAFAQALESIKKGTGLSYKMLAQATSDTNYPLASSTVHGMCTKPKLPAGVDSVRCFIEVCGGDQRTQQRWAAAWQRLRQAPADATAASPALAADAEAARRLLIDATTENKPRTVWTLPEEVTAAEDADEPGEPQEPAEVVTREALHRLLFWLLPLVFVFGAVTGALVLSLLT
ncbi:hypothetical protein ACFWNN_10675 [Lentzea sp. NPDC058450]|uniref:hypothetical protein n=1 Tax=Lentzea sp. NPDC058450 TaxID=3346505 RepID=UPI0036600368